MNKIGGGILYLFYGELNSKPQKIHYIEVVPIGKSEVLKYASAVRLEEMSKLFGGYGTKIEDRPISTPEAGSIEKTSEYMTGFWMNKANVYNIAQKGSFLVKGSYEGLNDIYYQNEKLVPNKDYFVGEQVIEFSEDFLDRLSDGENKLTLRVDGYNEYFEPIGNLYERQQLFFIWYEITKTIRVHLYRQ